MNLCDHLVDTASEAVHVCPPSEAVYMCPPSEAVHMCPPSEAVHMCPSHWTVGCHPGEPCLAAMVCFDMLPGMSCGKTRWPSVTIEWLVAMPPNYLWDMEHYVCNLMASIVLISTTCSVVARIFGKFWKLVIYTAPHGDPYTMCMMMKWKRALICSRQNFSV